MIWIAPTEKDTANDALEKRLWDAADQFRTNSGLKCQEYSAPVPYLPMEARYGFPLNCPETHHGWTSLAYSFKNRKPPPDARLCCSRVCYRAGSNETELTYEHEQEPKQTGAVAKA